MNPTPPFRISARQDGRILVLEPDAELMGSILTALREAAPNAKVNIAHNLEEAHGFVLTVKPDLFVLDVDATYDLGQEFIYDLRTSHPNARAIILTAIHLAGHREQASGLGAIHFLEKPFPHQDFVDLVEMLLRAGSGDTDEKFQGTLSDLHISDIIQLKCMSGSTSGLEFTGPRGQKARVFFENGQVCHAIAPDKEGMDAFNEIVSWKGGRISEVSKPASIPRTINLDWQVLLMEAVRHFDETGATKRMATPAASNGSKGQVLMIDDSIMLLNFVDEVLRDANYEVATAATAEDGLRAVKEKRPDLILLDYLLPDMKGDAVSQRLFADPETKSIPVVYVSGLAGELGPGRNGTPNVIGFLNKPFTSDLLIKTLETHMPNSPDDPQPAQGEIPLGDERASKPAPERESSPEPVESAPEASFWTQPEPTGETSAFASAPTPESATPQNLPDESMTGGFYFCADTSFCSLNWALQTLSKGKLNGAFRCFWHKDAIDLLTDNGQIVLATTRDPELYCPESPVTLANVDPERVTAARNQQLETGCPLFVTLSQEGLVLQEPATQLVQHHSQKLFAHLWTAPLVRFVFHRGQLPSYANGFQPDGDIDNWALATLRFVQYNELGQRGNYDSSSIPAYTRDGFGRVQDLRLTVAEAQFASQFNGVRSIQQIAKNLRLDLKFARLTLFRFLALEIVELWPASTAAKPEKKGVFSRFARTIGVGE